MRRLLKSNRGVAEIVGTTLFLAILLFFFVNVFLWQNQVVGSTQNILSAKLNSPVELKTTFFDIESKNLTLQLNNLGGVDASPVRLWIINSTTHMYSDMQMLNVWIHAGSQLNIYIRSPIRFNPDGTLNSTLDLKNSNNIVVSYALPTNGNVTFKLITNLGNTAACSYTAPSSVSEGFIPDYDSLEWASINSSHQVKSWNTGWIIPSNQDDNVVFKINVTYYGQTSITLGNNTKLFLWNSTKSSILYIAEYNTANKTIMQYQENGAPIPLSPSGTQLILYFGISSAKLAEGYRIADLKPEAMAILMIYAKSPDHYAQSLPLDWVMFN